VELNIPTFVGQTIAMIVFVIFCMKFIWPPIMGMLEERQTSIADGLAAADKGNRALEEAEVEKTVILDAARGQAREILDMAINRGSGIVDEARTEAGTEKDRILASAQSEVEQEANRAREELRGQVGAIAVAGAEKILQREIDANTHKDLLDKLAAEI
jgi:F-type H+-transporting ATPase subunit b